MGSLVTWCGVLQRFHPSKRAVPAGLVHMYAASEFDAPAVVKQMKAGRRWPEKRLEYLKEDSDASMSDNDICERWAKNGRAASARGTLLHFHAECLLNNVQVAEPHSQDFVQIIRLNDALRELGFLPFRTEAPHFGTIVVNERWKHVFGNCLAEVCLFHCGLCVAGQCDALYIHETTSELCLLDWKRVRQIKFENSFRTLKEPLQTLPDTNGWLYALPP